MRKKILIGILLIGCILMKPYITDIDSQNKDTGVNLNISRWCLGYNDGHCPESCGNPGMPHDRLTCHVNQCNCIYNCCPESVDASGHSYGPWEDSGDGANHVRHCIAYAGCTVSVTAAHNFSLSNGCCATGKKCSVCGAVQAHSCHNHSGGVATCVDAGYCSICSAAYISPLGHYFSVTCCQAGNKCSRCGTPNHSPCIVCTYVTCTKPHCGVTYCVHCTGPHVCSGDHSYVVCGQVHCGQTYCTKSPCTHTCGGGHSYITCPSAHCGQNYCTKAPCTHTCGGGHSYTICSQAHCGQTYCTKAPCTHTCGGGHVNSNSWTDLGSSHVVRCSVSSCTYNYASHQESSWGLWTNYTEQQHRRICNTCNASAYNNKIYETENHLYNKDYTALATNNSNYLQYHSATCYANNCGKIINQSHIDTNDDYICDNCSAELWRLTYNPPEPNLVGGSNNIIATLEVWKQVYCSSPGIERTSNTFTYTFTENGYFDFIFGTTDKTVRAEVNRINRTVGGRIIYTPISVTSGSVTATFIPDYEEDTYGELLKNGKVISIDGHSVPAGSTYDIYEFTQNGTQTFSITDNIGNSKNITATVNWIIEGNKAIASSTYQVMSGGYVFTNILVKANEAWTVSGLVNKIDIEVKENASGAVVSGVTKNVMEVTNYYTGEAVTDNAEKGVYIIKIAIGGAGVFTDSDKVYEVKLNKVSGDGTTVFTGRNKVEVQVYTIIDLT